MLKFALLMLITTSMVSTSVFAETIFQVTVSNENIKSLDPVLITGKITDVSKYKPVKLTVIAPDGSVVYNPLIAIMDNGEFSKTIHPTLPSFQSGKYTIIASHEDTEKTAQAHFTVTSQEITKNTVEPSVQTPNISEKDVTSQVGILMSADAINGSDIIKIKGNSSYKATDITLIVKSPTGNLITIGQVTPGLQGDFEVEIKTGGPLWKEDGMYTITANQGTSSQYKRSIQVEIEDGVVVPEFGVIASLILTISIISIIIISAKTKIMWISRY